MSDATGNALLQRPFLANGASLLGDIERDRLHSAESLLTFLNAGVLEAAQ